MFGGGMAWLATLKLTVKHWPNKAKINNRIRTCAFWDFYFKKLNTEITSKCKIQIVMLLIQCRRI